MREVRFVCQHYGRWTVYLKTTPGNDRYICEGCRYDRHKAMGQQRRNVLADQQRKKEQRLHETL